MSLDRFDTIDDLDAANATIRSLKTKLKSLYNSETASIIQRQMAVAKKRAEENQRRHNAAMRTILENVTFGFFLVDAKLVVQAGASLSCHALLGTDRLAGRRVVDVLRLQDDDACYFELCMASVFEDVMPEELTLDTIPNQFRFNGRAVRLEGRVVRDAAQAVDKVLFTVSDITALENAERCAQKNQMLVSILKSREAFIEFLGATKASLEEAHALAQAGGPTGDPDVRRIVHTVKGNAGSFGMADFAAFVHATEENAQITAQHIAEIEQRLVAFLEANHDVLEVNYADLGSTVFEISSREIMLLKTIIANLPSGRRSRELQSWTARVSEKPAQSMLGPVDDFAKRLAQRLNKRLDVHVHGLSTPMNAELMRPIFQNLTHIIRNAVGHGIEPAHERAEAGKPEAGVITIHLGADEHAYSIHIKDDGRGINTSRLLACAVAKGVVRPEEYEPAGPGKLVELVFVDGLSSAEHTSEIEGRGVGMGSVRRVVHAARGTIAIDTEPGRGTSFYITVPRVEAVPLRAPG